jgi:hypothetical protein
MFAINFHTLELSNNAPLVDECVESVQLKVIRLNHFLKQEEKKSSVVMVEVHNYIHSKPKVGEITTFVGKNRYNHKKWRV